MSSEDGPIWRDGKPNPDDTKHCGLLYDKKVEDWDCFQREKFICQIGGNGCGQAGKIFTSNSVDFSGHI